MFERYTEKARRVIFFARYEASQLGATWIEPEHLLLALVREDKFLQAHTTLEEIRNQICTDLPTSEPLPSSIDLPLSQRTKQILTKAAQESDSLHHRHIGTEHLSLALIKAEQSLAGRILRNLNIRTETVMAFIEEAITEETAPAQPQAIPGGVIGGIAEGISTQEFYSQLAEHSGVGELKASFNRLLELLVQKGVISEGEKNEMSKPPDA